MLTKDRPSDEQFTENITTDVQYAINKCDSLGSGKRLILHGNPSAIARDFHPHMAVLRRHFLPNMQFWRDPSAPLEQDVPGNSRERSEEVSILVRNPDREALRNIINKLSDERNLRDLLPETLPHGYRAVQEEDNSLGQSRKDFLTFTSMW